MRMFVSLHHNLAYVKSGPTLWPDYLMKKTEKIKWTIAKGFKPVTPAGKCGCLHPLELVKVMWWIGICIVGGTAWNHG